MKTKHKGSYKRSCPNINSIKEKEITLLQRPLAILKASVVSINN
jgi:hypothetical protein